MIQQTGAPPAKYISFSTLHLTGSLDASRGGPPEAVAGITSALKSLGVNVCVMAVGTSNEDSPALQTIRSSDIQTKLLRASGWRERWQISFRAPIFILKQAKRYDVIVVHGFYSFSLLSALWLRPIHRRPVVVMPHGSLEPYQEKQNSRRKTLFKYVALKGCGLSAFAVASPSEALGLRKHTWITRPIYVAGLGIDRPLDMANLPARSLPSPTHASFTVIGRIAEKKRIDICIEALKKLHQRGWSIRLQIAGTGNEVLYHELLALVKNLNLEKDVDFLGQVLGISKWQLLMNTDVVVLPSENENFAIAIACAVRNTLLKKSERV